MFLPPGEATGSVAVVTYDIDDTDYKLVVMWSVPFDFNLYEVLFNIKVGLQLWDI